MTKIALSGYPEIILQSQSKLVTGRAKLWTQASRDKSVITAFEANLEGRREERVLKENELATSADSKSAESKIHVPSL